MPHIEVNIKIKLIRQEISVGHTSRYSILFLEAVRDHSVSTYAKFSEKLTFLTPGYAHIRVRISGLEMLVFRKILRTYLMNDLLDRYYHSLSE